jgi:hypothetical protein
MEKADIEILMIEDNLADAEPAYGEPACGAPANP